MSASRPRISDHALVRFLERAGGMDVEGLRETLAASLERAYTSARSIGDGDFLIQADSLTYVVRGEAVVTVLTASNGKQGRALPRRSR